MKNISPHTVFISLTVALGGFLMGFDASVISGVLGFIETAFELNEIQLGWAVSSLTLSATLSMLLAGPLSDRISRKKVLSIAAVLYALSAVLSALAPSFTILVMARMLGGLGVGASLIIAPMYIAEIAPPKARGLLVSFNQLNIVIGISVAFFTNYAILKLGQSEYSWVANLGIDKYNWRWMLGLEAIPAVIYFFSLFFVPKSPRWLIMKNKLEEAISVMKKTLAENYSPEKIKTIQQSLKTNENQSKARLKELFQPALKHILIIGLALAVLQQITGINSVFFYAPMIFGQTGLGADASFTQAIYVGLTNLLFTIVAMSLIDKIGRKALLIIGVTGIAISMFILSYGFNNANYYLSEESLKEFPEDIRNGKLELMSGKTYQNDLEFKIALKQHLGTKDAKNYEQQILQQAIQINSTLILLAILAFVASFAVSVGPVMWVLFSELFPNRIRAIAISFVGFVNSIVSFLVQLLFPWELSALGNAGTFFIYALFAAAGLIFIILKVPETKGKSLEELQLILIKNHK